MGTLRPIAAALAVALLTGLLTQVGWASPGALTVTVRPAPSGAVLTVSAPGPFRFSLRQLRGPDRLVVDLTGLDVAAASGTQEVNLAPVRAVRVARGRGFVQVVLDLAGPVLADLDLAADGRRLTLRLQAMGTHPPPRSGADTTAWVAHRGHPAAASQTARGRGAPSNAAAGPDGAP